jgi:hypothetical protein
LTLALGFTAVPAHAQSGAETSDAKEKARSLVAKGNRAFKRADYEEAAEAFLGAFGIIEANRLTPKPDLLYNAGLAYERLDRCDRVAELYEKFLTEKPEAATPDLEYRLEKARACAPEIEISTDPGGAKVIIDGVERGISPLSLRVRSGEHRLHLALAGYASLEETIDVDPKGNRAFMRVLESAGDRARAETPAINASPEPRPSQPGAPPPIAPPSVHTPAVPPRPGTLTAPIGPEAPSSSLRPWAWVTGGTGVAALGTGVILAVLTQNAIDRRDAEIAKGTDQANDRYVRDQQNQAASLAVARDVTLGVGAASVVTSAVLFLLAAKDEAGSGALAVSPKSGGLEAGWRVAW